MKRREPLSIEQTNKIILVSRWLFKISMVQLELQMSERWDKLEELRKVYVGLSEYLLRIVDETDDLSDAEWEERLFSELFQRPTLLQRHKEAVGAMVRGAIMTCLRKNAHNAGRRVARAYFGKFVDEHGKILPSRSPAFP